MSENSSAKSRVRRESKYGNKNIAKVGVISASFVFLFFGFKLLALFTDGFGLPLDVSIRNGYEDVASSRRQTFIVQADGTTTPNLFLTPEEFSNIQSEAREYAASFKYQLHFLPLNDWLNLKAPRYVEDFTEQGQEKGIDPCRLTQCAEEDIHITNLFLDISTRKYCRYEDSACYEGFNTFRKSISKYYDLHKTEYSEQ